MSTKKNNMGNNQLSFFDLIQNQKQKPLKQGSLNIHTQFCNLITDEIRQSNLSRFQIASLMSELLAQDFTKSMLDSYTADSKEAHRFPAEFLPAFKEAVNSYQTLDFLARKSGVFLLPSDDALRSEVQKLEEQIEHLQNERDERLLFLKIKNNKD